MCAVLWPKSVCGLENDSLFGRIKSNFMCEKLRTVVGLVQITKTCTLAVEAVSGTLSFF